MNKKIEFEREKERERKKERKSETKREQEINTKILIMIEQTMWEEDTESINRELIN